MNYYLTRVADGQGGVVMRHQARDAGYAHTEIDELVRRKKWVAIRRGAYVERERYDKMDEVERHTAAVHAVVRSLKAPAVVSHTSAAVMRGLPTWNLDLSEVHVSRSDLRSSRFEAGVRHHCGEIRDDDVEEIDGIRVMSIPRTIIDTARITDFEPALCVADAALRGQDEKLKAVTLDRLDDMRDWPGSRNAGAVVEFANGLSESVGESRTRVLFRDVGLPIPELQVEVRDQRGILVARTDFLWELLRTIAEFDGRQKYEKYLNPGETGSDVLWREKKREDAIRQLGYEVIRIIWTDLEHPERVLRRVLAAFERGKRFRAA